MRLFGLLAATLSLSACALIAGHPEPIPCDDYLRSDTYMRQHGFTVMADAAKPIDPAHFGDAIRRVYVTGKGPRVILLHELPGLRPEDVDLAEELGQRFEVSVPLLFGVAGQDSNRLGYSQACVSGLFSCDNTNAKHRILDPLRELVRQVCKSADCGIVGMCLTGSLPLWLMTEDNVVSVVVAQPSLPFFHPIWPLPARSDISGHDVDAAMDVTMKRHASIYLTRYRHDLISSHRTFTLLDGRMRSRLKPNLVNYRSLEISGHGHSTLVRDSGHAVESKLEFRELVQALNDGFKRER